MRRSSAFRPYKLAPSAERSAGVKRDYTASAPISPRRRSSEVGTRVHALDSRDMTCFSIHRNCFQAHI